MIPIKFRGETFCGEFIFGYVVRYDDGEVAITNGFENRFVKPTSVAQFVGYDKNGAEIYSDDVLLDDFGAKVKATIGFNLSYDKLIRPIGEKVGIVEVIKDD